MRDKKENGLGEERNMKKMLCDRFRAHRLASRDELAASVR
jgi:hypothetical protein